MRVTLPIAAAVWLVSTGLVEARCVEWRVEGRNLECIREIVSSPRRSYRKKRYHRKPYRIAARPPIKAPAEPLVAPITPAPKTDPLPAVATTVVPFPMLTEDVRMLRDARDRLRFDFADEKRTRMPAVARTAATAGQGNAFRPAAVDAPSPSKGGVSSLALIIALALFALIGLVIALPRLSMRLFQTGDDKLPPLLNLTGDHYGADAFRNDRSPLPGGRPGDDWLRNRRHQLLAEIDGPLEPAGKRQDSAGGHGASVPVPALDAFRRAILAEDEASGERIRPKAKNGGPG